MEKPPFQTCAALPPSQNLLPNSIWRFFENVNLSAALCREELHAPQGYWHTRCDFGYWLSLLAREWIDDRITLRTFMPVDASSGCACVSASAPTVSTVIINNNAEEFARAYDTFAHALALFLDLLPCDHWFEVKHNDQLVRVRAQHLESYPTLINNPRIEMALLSPQAQKTAARIRSWFYLQSCEYAKAVKAGMAESKTQTQPRIKPNFVETCMANWPMAVLLMLIYISNKFLTDYVAKRCISLVCVNSGNGLIFPIESFAKTFGGSRSSAPAPQTADAKLTEHHKKRWDVGYVQIAKIQHKVQEIPRCACSWANGKPTQSQMHFKAVLRCPLLEMFSSVFGQCPKPGAPETADNLECATELDRRYAFLLELERFVLFDVLQSDASCISEQRRQLYTRAMTLAMTHPDLVVKDPLHLQLRCIVTTCSMLSVGAPPAFCL